MERNAVGTALGFALVLGRSLSLHYNGEQRLGTLVGMKRLGLVLSGLLLASFSLGCGEVKQGDSDATASVDAATTVDAMAALDAVGDPDAGIQCLEGMEPVPSGILTMSNAVEVTVEEFCMDHQPVTMNDYNACVGAANCTAANAGNATNPALYCNRSSVERGTDPANCVDFDQAVAYCAAQGKFLPSEAQWEWAARGGTEARLYPWGAQIPLATDSPERLCWQAGRTGEVVWPGRPQGTCPVGVFNQAMTHPFALEDMSGNIWHWTRSGDGTTSVVRGGGWDNSDPARVTTSFRNVGIAKSTRHSAVGFRCVAQPAP